jgi:hypothetical protein
MIQVSVFQRFLDWMSVLADQAKIRWSNLASVRLLADARRLLANPKKQPAVIDDSGLLTYWTE